MTIKLSPMRVALIALAVSALTASTAQAAGLQSRRNETFRRVQRSTISGLRNNNYRFVRRLQGPRMERFGRGRTSFARKSLESKREKAFRRVDELRPSRDVKFNSRSTRLQNGRRETFRIRERTEEGFRIIDVRR
jgi:hypothetical protein